MCRLSIENGNIIFVSDSYRIEESKQIEETYYRCSSNVLYEWFLSTLFGRADGDFASHIRILWLGISIRNLNNDFLIHFDTCFFFF